MGFKHEIKLPNFRPVGAAADRVFNFFGNDDFIERVGVPDGLFQAFRYLFGVIHFSGIPEIFHMLLYEMIRAITGFAFFVINQGVVETGNVS